MTTEQLRLRLKNSLVGANIRHHDFAIAAGVNVGQLQNFLYGVIKGEKPSSREGIEKMEAEMKRRGWWPVEPCTEPKEPKLTIEHIGVPADSKEALPEEKNPMICKLMIRGGNLDADHLYFDRRVTVGQAGQIIEFLAQFVEPQSPTLPKFD